LIVSERLSAWFRVPEEPVIVSVAFVGGKPTLPPTLPLLLPPPHPLRAARHVKRTAKIGIRGRLKGLAAKLPLSISRIQVARAAKTYTQGANGHGVAGDGTIAALEVLLTVTVKEALDGTDVGEIEQVDEPGDPLQVSETFPLKPLIADTCKLYVAV
jgi:hypothetical protein